VRGRFGFGPAAATLVASAVAFSLAASTGCVAPRRRPTAQQEPQPPSLSTPTRVAQRYEYFLYEVQKGDTIYSLSKRFKVSQRELAELNDIKDVTALPTGKILLVPRADGVVPPPLGAGKPPGTSPALRRRLAPSELHRGKPSSRFWWPTSGRVIRHYGERVRGLPESGITIAAPAGTEVCAVADGTVITCVGAQPGATSAWGNVVAVAHAGNVVSWYAHLGSMAVRKGSRVRRGQVIGTVGSSGAAERPELAFRLFRNGRMVNPETYLP